MISARSLFAYCPVHSALDHTQFMLSPSDSPFDVAGNLTFPMSFVLSSSAGAFMTALMLIERKFDFLMY